MRAVRFDGEFVRVVTDAPDPALPPGEALVHPTRVLATPADALAGSPTSGFAYRGVLGHQFVGIVKKINAPDARLAGASGPACGPLLVARKGLLGARVVGSPILACTNCDLCRGGLSPHCRARRVMGLHAREGCFADLFAIPMMNLCPVPESVEDDRAVFAVAAAGAVHVLHLLRAAGRHYLSVIGDGVGALLTAQLLARENPATRLLFTRPDRARLCEKWGIRHRGIEEPGRRQDQDVVVECTGTPAGLRLALQLVRPRGVVVMKSPLAGAPFAPGQTWGVTGAWGKDSCAAAGLDLTAAVVNEVQIVGCREGSVAEGLGVLADGRVDVLSLIGKRWTLDDAPASIGAAAGGDAVVMDV